MSQWDKKATTWVIKPFLSNIEDFFQEISPCITDSIEELKVKCVLILGIQYDAVLGTKASHWIIVKFS